MLQGEHSTILSTFIKLPFVIKILVLSIFEWPFYTGFTVLTYVRMFKEYIRAGSDLLLNISLAGGQSLKWISHERIGGEIYKLTTDRQTVIYQAANHCQHEYISILTHKMIKNMNEYFKVYKDSAILERALEFPVTLVWTEAHIFTAF